MFNLMIILFFIFIQNGVFAYLTPGPSSPSTGQKNSSSSSSSRPATYNTSQNPQRPQRYNSESKRNQTSLISGNLINPERNPGNPNNLNQPGGQNWYEGENSNHLTPHKITKSKEAEQLQLIREHLSKVNAITQQPENKVVTLASLTEKLDTTQLKLVQNAVESIIPQMKDHSLNNLELIKTLYNSGLSEIDIMHLDNLVQNYKSDQNHEESQLETINQTLTVALANTVVTADHDDLSLSFNPFRSKKSDQNSTTDKIIGKPLKPSLPEMYPMPLSPSLPSLFSDLKNTPYLRVFGSPAGVNLDEAYHSVFTQVKKAYPDMPDVALHALSADAFMASAIGQAMTGESVNAKALNRFVVKAVNKALDPANEDFLSESEKSRLREYKNTILANANGDDIVVPGVGEIDGQIVNLRIRATDYFWQSDEDKYKFEVVDKNNQVVQTQKTNEADIALRLLELKKKQDHFEEVSNEDTEPTEPSEPTHESETDTSHEDSTPTDSSDTSSETSNSEGSSTSESSTYGSSYGSSYSYGSTSGGSDSNSGTSSSDGGGD